MDTENLSSPAAGEDANIVHWLEESRMQVSYTYKDPDNQGDVISMGCTGCGTGPACEAIVCDDSMIV